MSKQCPICNSSGKKVLSLTDRFLRPFYQQNYSPGIPKTVRLGNYSIMRCTRCSLEWANPLKPGDSRYYTWLTNHSGYYPQSRWEWQLVFRFIKKKNPTLLEVGCGSGSFLSLCRDRHIKAVGVDLTKSAVDQAKSQGLEAFPLTLSSYARKYKTKFDYVVAFHLLEHVADPSQLIADMKSVLKPDGIIFVSTPYTHQRKSLWFDYLNYPPHHLTRWNKPAYQQLADKYRLIMKFYMPPVSRYRSLLFRFENEMRLIFYGPGGYHSVTQLKLFLRSLLRPLTSTRALLRYLFPEKVLVDNPDTHQPKTQPADYVCLVALSPK